MKGSLLILVLALGMLGIPAQASDQGSPWQDIAPAANSDPYSYNGGSISGQSSYPAPISSGQFHLGFGSAGLPTGPYAGALPPTSTSSVNISICDATAAPPVQTYCPSNSSGCSNPSTENLPPAPGPGYQPIYQHGVFVGYLSPELTSLMQTDPASAWTQFANSPDFTGPEGLRLSLLAETGAASPEQMAALESMAMFGM